MGLYVSNDLGSKTQAFSFLFYTRKMQSLLWEESQNIFIGGKIYEKLYGQTDYLENVYVIYDCNSVAKHYRIRDHLDGFAWQGFFWSQQDKKQKEII